MYSGPSTGLYVSPNPFSKTPAGTLKKANNVRFTAPGELSPRPGFRDFIATFGSANSLADALSFYGTSILVAYDLTKVALYTTDSFVFTDFTEGFSPVGLNRMRFEDAARSIFFNTAAHGLYSWDGVGSGGQPVQAGNELPVTPMGLPSGTSGWQSPDSTVSYRSTICSKDAFQRVIEGPPSGRLTVTNKMVVEIGGMVRVGTTVTVNYNSLVTVGDQGPLYNLTAGDVVTLTPGEANFPAGAKTVVSANTATAVFTYTEAGAATANTAQQTFELPTSGLITIPLHAGSVDLVTTDSFIRLYRSEETATASDVPSDEMFLAFESPFITAADLAAGFITIADTAPEDVLDVPLYTNQNTGDGALAARYKPPRSLDIVYWASRMWFANTVSRPSATFTLVGTGGSEGLIIGDKVVLAASADGSTPLLTYFADAIESLGPPVTFRVFTQGDLGFNIEQTARSFCKMVNADPSNSLIAAYYVSSEGGAPGKILIVENRFDDTPMYLFSDRETAWTPQLPDPTTPLWPPLATDENAHPAGLSWSSIGIPDGVPLVNFLVINSDNDPILRVFPLHYRLIIFKTDGIYSCTNIEPFSVQKISAYKLLAPDSVQVLEDRLYALTDQGLVSVSDSGVEPVSEAINSIFNELATPSALANLAHRTFGVSHRTERQYLCWTLDFEDDGTISPDPEQALVLSTLEGGFTRYPVEARCGVIDPNTGELTLGSATSNKLFKENRNLTLNDYIENAVAITVTGSSGSVVTLSSAAAVAAGDLLAQSDAHGSTARYLVTSVSGNAVTVLGTPAFTNGGAFVLQAIHCEVEFNKFTGGAPTTMKMVQQTTLLFDENTVHDVTENFHSEIQTVDVPVVLSVDGWGEQPWGVQPWGSLPEPLLRVEPLPPSVANCAQLSVGFETRQAAASFKFLGVDVVESEDTVANHG